MSIPGIEFVKGIPSQIDQESYFDISVRNLMVIDDQMIETGNDERIAKLFTKGSHHRNLSVIYIVQNLFHQGRVSRSISLNSHYLVLFKNPRDKMQVMTLAKQMYPRNTYYFLEKYEEAVQKPFGYLFVDLKPTTSDQCRLRTNVLPGEMSVQKDDNVGKELLKFLRHQNRNISPEKRLMTEKEEEMSHILHNQNMGPSEKLILYTQLQNDLLRMKHKASHTPFLDMEPPKLAVPKLAGQETPSGAAALVPEPATIPYSLKEPISKSVSYSTSSTPVKGNWDDVVPSPLTQQTPSVPLKKAKIRLKNYLDDDAETSVGPYAKHAQVKRYRLRSYARDSPYKYSKDVY